MTVKAHWELQQALYALLEGDGTLDALISATYDHVPQEAEYPYLVLREINGREWNTDTTSGVEADVTLEVFAREKTRKTCLDILHLVHQLLHDADLTLTNYTLINLRYISSEVSRQTDGLTFRGQIRFRAVLQES